VQPVFNRDVIAGLSDSAASNLLELEAWINGDEAIGLPDAPDDTQTSSKGSGSQTMLTNLESDLFAVLSQSDMSSAANIVSQLLAHSEDERKTTITTVFLRTIADGPLDSLKFLLDTGFVDTARNDEITDRGCLHEAAITGRLDVVKLCVEQGIIALKPKLT